MTRDGETKMISASYIIIAVGGRPSVPSEEDVPGVKRYAITSDDLFSWKKAPGKTLIVGASYIALECAGFLTEFGFETKVAVRSILLRGFDRQCAEKVGKLMEELGTTFLWGTIISKVEKMENDRLKVSFSREDLADEEFDTVLYAAGRLPQTKFINCEAVGIECDREIGKIITDDEDRTSVPSIYAIGDVCKGKPELTPVAIRAGEFLARRLFDSANNHPKMDYYNVPTTIFTPVEYGCCGLSEEDAIAKYGEANIEVYLFEFSPLEVSAAHWKKIERCRADEYDTDLSTVSLSKVVCLKSQHEKVIGIHFIGLQAGETMQGLALAIKAGLTKAHINSVLGIHPTDAESFTEMRVTRRSGENWVAAAGCGGGKCG